MATINGTPQHDELYGTTKADLIHGYGGDDYIQAGDGNDNARGDDGNDSISGENGSDKLFGGNGYDFLNGGAGNDTLYGNAADDSLQGGAGNDVLDGGNGNEPGGLASWFDEDTATYLFEGGGGGVTVNLAAGTATDTFGNTDTLIGIEDVAGSEQADTLIGGNAANDAWESFTGNAGNDIIDGGSGFDVVSYRNEYGQNFAILADLAAGTVTDTSGDTDTLSNIEAIIATMRDDTLLGSALGDEFQPLAGSDIVDGRGGSDTVSYQYDSSSSARGINASLVRGSVIDMNRYIDLLTSIENVTGGYLDDTIRGDSNANTLKGWYGDDLLRSAGGNDSLIGGDGQDILSAGVGDDRLEGGSGNDNLRGGAGGDTFVFGLDCDEDTVMDFVTGTDKIDVSAFGYASAAIALAHVRILSADTAALDLGADRYAILNYVNTSGVFITAADFVI